MFNSMESHSRQYAKLQEEKREKERNKGKEPEKKEPVEKKIAKNFTELQAMRIERMMSNPNKTMVIPESRKVNLDMRDPREFNSNVMGSTAGAGSGEFHVYRATRRREMLRQELMEMRNQRDKNAKDFDEKQEAQARADFTKTAKNRMKRQRQKEAKAAYLKQQKQEKAMAAREAAANDKKGEDR